MLLTLGAELASAQSQGATGGIYTCVDRNGRRLTADRPIPECLDREQRELSPSGITRRQIGPSLTELERAAQDAQNRKDAEERARVVEERRRERVLVARYPDKAAHDAERAAAIQLVDDVTVIAEKRLVELAQLPDVDQVLATARRRGPPLVQPEPSRVPMPTITPATASVTGPAKLGAAAPVRLATISAPSGRPITKAHAPLRGKEPSARPKARAAMPDTPAIRPAPSSISAAASPISTPPASPATGAASGNPGRIIPRSPES